MKTSYQIDHGNYLRVILPKRIGSKKAPNLSGVLILYIYKMYFSVANMAAEPLQYMYLLAHI